MPHKENQSLAIQSITQLGVRGLTYLSVLILLPSFILITEANTYSDIVLISTLISLTPLFDGGHAVSVLTVLSNSKIQESKKTFLSIILSSIKGSFCWSALISIVFVGVWLITSPKYGGIWHASALICGCVFLSIVSTLANTLARVLITKDFNRQTAFILLFGPALSSVILFFIRLSGHGDPFLIIFAFAIGGIFAIIGSLYKIWNFKFSEDVFFSFLKKEKYFEEIDRKKNRRWIFVSQIISILVVAKTPIMIRALCGNQTLGLYSVLAAGIAIIIAPIAAMQAPLLVRYAKLVEAGDVKFKKMGSILIRHTSIAIGFGLCLGGGVFVCVSFIGKFFNKDFSSLSYLNMIVVALSASIYILSAVVAIFLNAFGQAKIMVKMAMLVLVLDTLLIFFMATSLKEITPIVTMPIANIVTLIIFFFVIKRSYQKIT